MKITKFPQSCVMVETKGKKILVDPGETFYAERFLKKWKTADAIFVTHRHRDHINGAVLEKLNIPIYSTAEVASHYPALKINIVKENDIIGIDGIKIEVVKAVHGFIVSEAEVFENVGFIIDDGVLRLYVTSDTVRFNNNYKADVMIANVTAFEASMGIWGAAQTAKDVNAKLVIVAHQDAGKMFYRKEDIENYFKEQSINFIIPKTLESFELKLPN